MIWWYITFCVFVFIFISWRYYKDVSALTYGKLILISLASTVPVLNVGIFLLFLWAMCEDILDKEVFK